MPYPACLAAVNARHLGRRYAGSRIGSQCEKPTRTNPPRNIPAAQDRVAAPWSAGALFCFQRRSVLRGFRRLVVDSFVHAPVGRLPGEKIHLREGEEGNEEGRLGPRLFVLCLLLFKFSEAKAPRCHRSPRFAIPL